MTPNQSADRRRGGAFEARLGVVCVAGGSGVRYGGDKLAEDLAGQPVLVRSIEALTEPFPGVPTVVVAAADRVERWSERLCGPFPSVAVVAGGQRRRDSVRIGVDHVRAGGADLVVVHDAARPLVHKDDVTAVVNGLGDSDGVVLCAAVVDTVKQVSSDGAVISTVDRASLRLAQTPQVFRIAVLDEAWREAGEERDFTDEAGLLEYVGRSVRTVIAGHANPKLTTRTDLVLIRSLWEQRV